MDIEKLADLQSRIRRSLSQVIVGQSSIIEQILIAVFARGHVLLVGVPGVAKTLLVKSLATVLGLEFKRIQFTPDLMPGDITGSEVLEEDKSAGTKFFRFIRGPLFTQVLLADEINRTPPKTQAALLEAMQERQVTVAGETHDLGEPFFVLATQNPIEQEGTYPLPEAQLDRFMFYLQIEYPEADEEIEVVQRTVVASLPRLEAVTTASELVAAQHFIRNLPVAENVVERAVELVRLTRDPKQQMHKYIRWGAGPRASQYLVAAARVKAALQGKLSPDVSDLDAVLLPVLQHRILTNFSAETDGVRVQDIITTIAGNK